MAEQIPVGEPEKRFSGNTVLMVLGVFVLLVAWAMFQFGSQALRMGPQAKELNSLMFERSLACAEPVDIDKCRAATEAVDAYGAVMEESARNRPTAP